MLKAVILVLEFNGPFHKLIPNEKWQNTQPKKKKKGRGVGGRRHRKKNRVSYETNYTRYTSPHQNLVYVLLNLITLAL